MASYKDFEEDFSALCQKCYECWTTQAFNRRNMLDYEYFDFGEDERSMLQDLQLAAELGKTLLERNKELEINLKEYQRLHDNQAKEIEYLTKQSAALRKTNEERIRIYEQLEVSIQELERANQKLALGNSENKKEINSLCEYRDSLESRCEELEKALDEARNQQQNQKKQIRQLSKRKNEEETAGSRRTTCATVVSQTSIEDSPAEEDFVDNLTKQNQQLKSQMSKSQRQIAHLEEEVSRSSLILKFLREELEEQELIGNSFRSELSTLKEENERIKNFCMRCCKELGNGDSQSPPRLEDEPLPRTPAPANKLRSLARALEEDKPYRNLLGMYQLSPKKQWGKQQSYSHCSTLSLVNHLSLKDELRFSNNNVDFEEDEEFSKEKRKGEGRSTIFSTSGADLSEEETSSGFSDETCNKFTQTERNAIPGSLLCSIADGDDCKFSIYDDACPIESRFKKIPEYRTLFREIFTVLKRAAEAKDGGEKLPLLDDLTPVSGTPRVPPVTPATENSPSDFDDPQSLAESANASEASSIVNEKMEENLKDLDLEASVSSAPTKEIKQTNDILKYLSVSVIVREKSKRKAMDLPARKSPEGADSGSPNSPRKSGGRRRKEWRNYDSSRPIGQRTPTQPHILTTLERGDSFRDPKGKATGFWSSQLFVSTAAQEVAKLKNLEKSYAEVLRHTPKNFARAKAFE